MKFNNRSQRAAVMIKLNALSRIPSYNQGRGKLSTFGENSEEQALIRKAFMPGMKLYICSGTDKNGNINKRLVVAKNEIVAAKRLGLRGVKCDEFYGTRKQLKELS